MIDTRILNIVSEDDEIVGEATRHDVHEKGLLHREVHVWLYNGKGELFFQKRAEDKDTFPGLLDASIGGHVEVGDSYEKTAVKEAMEETGLEINPADLKLAGILKYVSDDAITGKINNSIKHIFAYRFDGSANELKIEEGKATGFEVVKLDSLFNMSDFEKKRFIPNIFDDFYLNIFRKIKEFI
jgi:isopentenyldiphosphate isomerase